MDNKDQREEDEVFRRGMKEILMPEPDPLPPGLALRFETRIKQEIERGQGISVGEAGTVASILLIVVGVGGFLDPRTMGQVLIAAFLALVYFGLLRWKFGRAATSASSKEPIDMGPAGVLS